MRLLQLHSDFIEYEPISKEIRHAEEIVNPSKVRIDDAVVILIAIESHDDGDVALHAVRDIIKYMDNVKSDKAVIYPYAHLSSDLASPDSALALLQVIEDSLKKTISHVKRAPFGWTKAFSVQVKGHPLAENSRTFTKDDVDHSYDGKTDLAEQPRNEAISTALKAEEKLQSYWYILTTDGSLVPINDYKFRQDESMLKALVDYEISKKRSVDEQPPHVRLMKKMAIADYEPASDAGNMRFYPKGRLMKSLIEQFVTRKVMDYGGIEVETPIMYDSKHPSMESYFNRFPARQYNIVSDNKQLFLRFAACFGQFLIAKDMSINYRHLPLRLYELTRYSFRREKSGEIVGLRRLRAFSMPDCHAICRDIPQAKEESIKRFQLSVDVLNGLGLSPKKDVELAVRFTEEFYNENKDYINHLVGIHGRPVLVEMWKERFFYFILKWEFNFIDNLGKASALSTDQIDVENGERYNIEFLDEDGEKKNPIILHNSPSGAVERVIYALLEKAARDSKRGQIPSFPLWLAHTQVRLIPVSKDHIDFCEKIAATLRSKNIRADIDDREETVGKKIRNSEMEWITYTLVIGDKELQTNILTVRDREKSSQRDLSLEDLMDEIKRSTEDKPYLPINLPLNLNKRPQIMV